VACVGIPVAALRFDLPSGSPMLEVQLSSEPKRRLPRKFLPGTCPTVAPSSAPRP